MPPQKYTPDQALKVINSDDFKQASPELQMQVREALGLIVPRPKMQEPPPPPPTTMDWLLGSFGPRSKDFAHSGLLESAERGLRARAAYNESSTHDQEVERVYQTQVAQANRETNPSRRRFLLQRAEEERASKLSYGNRVAGQFFPRAGADMLALTRSTATPKNAVLTAASFVPFLRPFVGSYITEQSGKELFSGRKPGETDADYLQRTLFALSGIAGGVALGRAGEGGLRGQMERRVGKATAAIGAPAEALTAFQVTFPDLAESMDKTGIRPKSVADVARLVEATNERFNTQMALAEQPYAADQIVPTKVSDALMEASREKALAGNTAEAKYLRQKALEYQKPLSLRQIGARMREFNRLFYKYTGKTSLEMASAKARGEATAIDVQRKALRDTYVDYLESKYPGAGFRDMRMRQEQILNLRDHLGEFNKQTGAFGKGFVQKLRADQMKFKYGSFNEPTGTVLSEHGARTYLRLPQFLKRGPETKANIRAAEAFGEGLGEGKIPRRGLKTLRVPPKTPPAAPPQAAGGPGVAPGGPGMPPGAGGPPGAPGVPPGAGGPPTPPGGVGAQPRPQTPPTAPEPVVTPSPTRSLLRANRPTAAATESQVIRNRISGLEEQLRVARTSGDANWIKRVEGHIAEGQKQLDAAKWKAAGVKPPSDAQNLQDALQDLHPGVRFEDLKPSEQSQVVQKAQAKKSAPPADKPIPGKFSAQQTTDWLAEMQRHREAVAMHKRHFEIHGDRQELERNLKGEGMRHSATKRQISGQLTPKETAEKARYERSFHRGKRVMVKGKEGQIVGMSFGKVRVKLSNGNIISANQEDVEGAK